MNRFGKLVLLELHRFWKIYAALMLITLISQFGGLFLSLRSYMNNVQRDMALNSLFSYEEYIVKFGRKLSFHIAVGQADPWFTGPVLLCIAALLFYVFFIWYRDWAGRNTFAYRLLMLPTARMNLFWAKLMTIMLLALGLVALQVVLLPLHLALFRDMVPSELAIPETVTEFVYHHTVFHVLLPATFMDFVLYYGAGLMAVSVIFAAILIERSFRLKGIIVGLAYTAGAGFAMISPMVINDGRGFELYPMEMFLLFIGIGAVLLVLSLFISWYLLTRKITV